MERRTFLKLTMAMFLSSAFPFGCTSSSSNSGSSGADNLMAAQRYTVIDNIQYFSPDGQTTYSAGIGDTTISGTSGGAPVEIGGGYTYDIEKGEIVFGEDCILHLTDLLIAENGHLYILDKIVPEILEFDLAGNFIGSYGGYGSTDSTFNMPSAFVTDGGTLYICDTGNRRIKTMSLTGVFGPSFSTGMTTDTVSDYPCSIAMDNDGLLHVLDGTYARVSVFTLSGELFLTYGGGFMNPVAIVIDGDGFIYIADSYQGAIHVFAKDCTYVGVYPILFPDGSFAHPRLLVLDFSGNLAIVARKGYKSYRAVQSFSVAEGCPSQSNRDTTLPSVIV